jgi:hypothetical protein
MTIKILTTKENFIIGLTDNLRGSTILKQQIKKKRTIRGI